MTRRGLNLLLLGVALLIAWQLLYFAVGEDAISPPGPTLVRAAGLLASPRFWHDAAATGIAFGYACAIGIVAGLVVGLLLGLNAFASDVADPVLGTVYSIPKITLYPVILLIFGLSLSAKVAFGVIHGFFPVAIFTMNALRKVAPVYRKSARSMRLSHYDTIVRVLAPAALPEILAGIRIGVAVTLLGTLIGELFASSSGIGAALIRAMEVHNVVDIIALTLLLFTFAAGLNAMLQAGERRMRP